MNKGVVSVLVAYLIWGLYPFYFHAMQHVAPAEIVIHRVLWTFALLAVYLFCSRRWRGIQKAVTDRRTVAVFLMSVWTVQVHFSEHCYSGECIQLMPMRSLRTKRWRLRSDIL